MRAATGRWGALAALFLLVGAVGGHLLDAGGTNLAAPLAATDRDDAAARIVAAHADHQSGLWVEAGGEVQRVLADDNEGSRHQRFIVRLSNDHTLLIAHNIDLAQRVPLEQGDRVDFRGEYEWNERGGVVHWTHHDPRNRHGGGWVEHQGTRYR